MAVLADDRAKLGKKKPKPSSFLGIWTGSCHLISAHQVSPSTPTVSGVFIKPDTSIDDKDVFASQKGRQV